jgi:hypothetical protein
MIKNKVPCSLQGGLVQGVAIGIAKYARRRTWPLALGLQTDLVG